MKMSHPRTLSPEEWEKLTDAEQAEHYKQMQRPFSAVNGHTMQRYPQFAGGRPIWSSAWTTCTDNCKACQYGEELPDW